MESNKDKLIKSIKDLEDAFINLNKIWGLEGNDDLMLKAENETCEYPFSRSFEELTKNVSEWSYFIRKKLD